MLFCLQFWQSLFISSSHRLILLIFIGIFNEENTDFHFNHFESVFVTYKNRLISSIFGIIVTLSSNITEHLSLKIF